MDKFQSELLAQLKEHNRLTKEIVKIGRANLELSKDVNNVNSRLADIIPQNPYTDTLGTYCGVNTSTEIFSAVKPRPANWLISPAPDKDDYVDHMCSHCGWTRHTYSDSILWKYCPNCGMKMSMEKGDEQNA